MAALDFEDSAPLMVLHRFAMRFPEAEEGTSCVKRAYRARKKAYVYLGMKADEYNVMVKLGESLAEAASLQKKCPDNYQVGKLGWTSIRFGHDETPPLGLLEGWIEESFRLIAPKALVESLPDQGLAPARTAREKASKKTTKKKAKKR